MIENTMPSLPAVQASPQQARIDQINRELMRLNQQWHDGQMSEPKWRQLRAELLHYLESELLPAGAQPRRTAASGVGVADEPFVQDQPAQPDNNHPTIEMPAVQVALTSTAPAEPLTALANPADPVPQDAPSLAEPAAASGRKPPRRWWWSR